MLDKDDKALRLLLLNARFDEWCESGRVETGDRYEWLVLKSIEMAEALATKAAISSSFFTSKKEDLIASMRLEIPVIMRKYEKDPKKRSASTSKNKVSSAPTKYTSYLTQQLKFVVQKFRRANYSPFAYTAQSYETLESLLTFLNRRGAQEAPMSIGSKELYEAARKIVRVNKDTGAPTLTVQQYNDACDLYFKTHGIEKLEEKKSSKDDQVKTKQVVAKARFDGSAEVPSEDKALSEWLVETKERLRNFKLAYEEGTMRPSDVAAIIGCPVNDAPDYYELLVNSGIDWDF